LDTTIVGIFDFKNVAAYGLAAGIVAFFIGIFRSIVTPVLQVFAKYHAKSRNSDLANLLHASSSLVSILLMITACWMVLPAGALFRIWVGPSIAELSVGIFTILIFANAIRQSGAPYGNYLVAVGLHKAAYLNPLSEGVVNLLASVGLGMLIGATGVAWGTAIGAVVGIVANFAYNLRRTMPAGFSIGHYFNGNIVMPLAVSFPMCIVLIAGLHFHLPLFVSASLMAVATVPSLVAARRQYRIITQSEQEAKLTPI
jgi:O-antigen/teichoic acid export membrane protein